MIHTSCCDSASASRSAPCQASRHRYHQPLLITHQWQAPALEYMLLSHGAHAGCAQTQRGLMITMCPHFPFHTAGSACAPPSWSTCWLRATCSCPSCPSTSRWAWTTGTAQAQQLRPCGAALPPQGARRCRRRPHETWNCCGGRLRRQTQSWCVRA